MSVVLSCGLKRRDFHWMVGGIGCLRVESAEVLSERGYRRSFAELFFGPRLKAS